MSAPVACQVPLPARSAQSLYKADMRSIRLLHPILELHWLLDRRPKISTAWLGAFRGRRLFVTCISKAGMKVASCPTFEESKTTVGNMAPQLPLFDAVSRRFISLKTVLREVVLNPL